jgi:threonine dehydrogenase-like Zn-dependent dehydrogenase
VVYDTSAESSRLFASGAANALTAAARGRTAASPLATSRASACSRTDNRFRARQALRFDAGALVTRRVSLDEVNDAFAAMERQEGIRTVITFPS